MTKNWSPCTGVRDHSDRPFPRYAASSRSLKPPVQNAVKPLKTETVKLNRSTNLLVFVAVECVNHVLTLATEGLGCFVSQYNLPCAFLL